MNDKPFISPLAAFWVFWITFTIIDFSFYFRTSFDYRDKHRYSIFPGGGIVAYVAEQSENAKQAEKE